ncbi:hypothetical protein B0H63DRAFT_529641 [Podospora didyma]|uniref:Fucose-specific lectin n=1 Tax=Podospora didyma TaxID=330526 RepID=A0AAE0K212_9PEZI|nr:hypothetical protein B0H63DRAFT_529641 [Podospora didyma]
MDFTGLISISFPDPGRPGKKMVRVYYQVGRQIRESCFNDRNGWHVRPSDDVVATNAKPRTPIAATNLHAGKKTSVFYLDDSNKLCRRTRVTSEAGASGEWKDEVVSASHPISPASKLSAVRTDEGDQNLRVYYQSTDNKIRGIVSYSDNGTWTASDLELDGMLPGTSLCAISGDTATRLFVQDKTKNIKEYYSDPDTDWRSNRIKPYAADAAAPITAVAWNYGTNQLQVRLFTLQNKNLVEFVYDKARGGWQQSAVATSQVAIESQSPGVTSAVTSTAMEQDGQFTVFYQPSQNVIAQFNSSWTVEQLGIPTARG